MNIADFNLFLSTPWSGATFFEHSESCHPTTLLGASHGFSSHLVDASRARLLLAPVLSSRLPDSLPSEFHKYYPGFVESSRVENDVLGGYARFAGTIMQQYAESGLLNYEGVRSDRSLLAIEPAVFDELLSCELDRSVIQHIATYESTLSALVGCSSCCAPPAASGSVVPLFTSKLKDLGADLGAISTTDGGAEMVSGCQSTVVVRRSKLDAHQGGIDDDTEWVAPAPTPQPVAPPVNLKNVGADDVLTFHNGAIRIMAKKPTPKLAAAPAKPQPATQPVENILSEVKRQPKDEEDVPKYHRASEEVIPVYQPAVRVALSRKRQRGDTPVPSSVPAPRRYTPPPTVRANRNRRPQSTSPMPPMDNVPERLRQLVDRAPLMVRQALYLGLEAVHTARPAQ